MTFPELLAFAACSTDLTSGPPMSSASTAAGSLTYTTLESDGGMRIGNSNAHFFLPKAHRRALDHPLMRSLCSAAAC